MKPQISFEDFLKVDLRIGTIVEATEFPEARNPSYKLKIDFGEEIGIKKSSAQITTVYSTRALAEPTPICVSFPWALICRRGFGSGYSWSGCW